MHPLEAELLSRLTLLPPRRRIWVAFSGGLDSTVLLHGLATLTVRFDAELRAIHVHHGLHEDADRWANFCSKICRELEVPLAERRIDLKLRKGESIEARARTNRYHALAEVVEEGDILVTAHHLDDQVETVMIQLMRGSGPSGLAGMPRIMPFARGHLARPMLDVTRTEIRSYALERGLSWIDDPSNQDRSFDRNFIRHEFLPLIERRWPGYRKTVARSARHCAEAQSLINELADSDQDRVRSVRDGALSVAGLQKLASPRVRAVLRTWMKSRGFPVPDSRRLDQVLSDILTARLDASPLVAWPGAEVRRYRDDLFIDKPLPDPPAGLRIEWPQPGTLDLPNGHGRLVVRPVSSKGLDSALWTNFKVNVRFRTGGERCRPPRRKHRHLLKKLFQERGVPPWLRDRIPLIFAGDELAAVGDLWVCEPFNSAPGQSGFVVLWEGHSWNGLLPLP